MEKFKFYSKNVGMLNLWLNGDPDHDYVEWKRPRNRLILHSMKKDDTWDDLEIWPLGVSGYAAISPVLEDHEPIRNVEKWSSAIWPCKGTVLDPNYKSTGIPTEEITSETVHLIHTLLKQYNKAVDAKSALDHINALNEIMRRRNK